MEAEDSGYLLELPKFVRCFLGGQATARLPGLDHVVRRGGDFDPILQSCFGMSNDYGDVSVELVAERIVSELRQTS